MDRTDYTERSSFRVRSRAGAAVVRPPAKIWAGNAQQFWEALASAIDAHAVIVVDLAETSWFATSGVSALLMALRRANDSGAELRIVSRDPSVDETFSSTGTYRLFRFFPSLSAALQAGQAAAAPVSAMPSASVAAR